METPNYRHYPSFTQIVRAITPCFNRVFCYFFKSTTTEYPKRLVRICRAASLFRDSVVTFFKNNQLAVEIGFRQISLSKSIYKEYSSVGLDAGIKNLDIRCTYGNAIFGKALLLEARGYQSVEETLFKFRFFTGISTLEKYIFVESELFLTISLRHEGKFKKAGERFFGLFNKVYPNNLKIFLIWNEIQYELGFISQATNFLVSEYLFFRFNPFSSGGKRYFLVIVNTYLIEILWEKYKNMTVNFRFFSAAELIFSNFRDLPCLNILTNYLLFAVFSGFGMINLMRLEWVAVLSYWEKAVNVAN
ncbi:uncharacterized protein PgNI_12165 [Pyricularia grisea]|uniref:Uncharacterized protein n=1 Tax=Pyricularia grisea TaxID=148305 RepID=A0A6P8AQT7_PYRGI|nr:uncharacterized protein PgNI_12165 [Pyricularia grisea]TLD04422.1 hypothetical protein PgNI_12165 [Pyricularia grisea]